MHTVNLDTRSLRSTLLLGAASVAALTLSLPASAQDQTTETVVVTGSRIPQQGLYAPSPVTAVGQQEMKFEGTTGVETLLNNLPSVFADQTAGESNGATGTATVNLRGLGAQRTLVLVNGTRLAPGDPTDSAGSAGGQNGAADLNEIPASLVDHVEVLTGGASAVYGSDALAGVVNFVMRKDFEGIEIDGQYGVAQADNTNSSYRSLVSSAGDQLAKENIWDGANETGTLVMGTNTANGKGNVTAYFSYQNTEAVLAGSRDFSACSFSTNTASTAHVCGGSSNYNKFISLDTKTTYFEQGTGAVGSGHFVPFVGGTDQLYNYGATNYLQRPDTRYSGGFFAHYEVNKELDVYTSFMFTDDDTIGQIAPRGLFAGTGAQGAVGFSPGSYFLINCTNPLMTAQEASLLCPGGGGGNLVPGEASVEVGRRAVESGPLTDELRHTSYRMQVGARGDLGDGWTYDVYGQYSESVFQKFDEGFFSVRNIQNALQVTGTAADPVCISGSPCVPLDIFNGIGSITPAMLKYVDVPALQQGYTEEQIVSGSLTGDLGRYGIQSPWAQAPVAISVGSEYRAEYLELNTDEEYESADLSGAGGATPSTPRSGFSVVEGFTELKAPLIQEKPFAEDLSFNAGYRYSSYSTAGSVSAYKYGLEYQPVDDFRIRASYERAVRAPNVLELFAPTNVILISAQDPCATSKAGACASVPNAGNAALLACPSEQCNQEVSGTATLKPEIGDTRTLGVVFTPTFLNGFTATADYFNIDVSNEIGTVSPDVTLANCYGATATAATEAEFCPAVHRNSIGQIYGSGYVSAPNVNTGFLHTKGMDFEANYNLSFDDIPMTEGLGGLQFAFVGTWLQEFEIEPVQGGTPYSCAGLYGPTCSNGTASGPLPRWRHRLRVTWATPWDVDFSVNWRYISGVKLDANTSIPQLQSFGTPFFDAPDNTINDFWYLDLAADWNVRTGVDLHAGVNNVFDRLPPALSTFVLPTGPGNDNTFPGTYDALGRTMFIGVTIKY
ncbi:MAG TPA: TonB-dependent receptor [Rhizomicrobium sp.]|nr:TonB-dependent receptor [Rhizomicrobium sp.]